MRLWASSVVMMVGGTVLTIDEKREIRELTSQDRNPPDCAGLGDHLIEGLRTGAKVCEFVWISQRDAFRVASAILKTASGKVKRNGPKMYRETLNRFAIRLLNGVLPERTLKAASMLAPLSRRYSEGAYSQLCNPGDLRFNMVFVLNAGGPTWRPDQDAVSGFTGRPTDNYLLPLVRFLRALVNCEKLGVIGDGKFQDDKVPVTLDQYKKFLDQHSVTPLQVRSEHEILPQQEFVSEDLREEDMVDPSTSRDSLGGTRNGNDGEEEMESPPPSPLVDSSRKKTPTLTFERPNRERGLPENGVVDNVSERRQRKFGGVAEISKRAGSPIGQLSPISEVEENEEDKDGIRDDGGREVFSSPLDSEELGLTGLKPNLGGSQPKKPLLSLETLSGPRELEEDHGYESDLDTPHRKKTLLIADDPNAQLEEHVSKIPVGQLSDRIPSNSRKGSMDSSSLEGGDEQHVLPQRVPRMRPESDDGATIAEFMEAFDADRLDEDVHRTSLVIKNLKEYSVALTNIGADVVDAGSSIIFLSAMADLVERIMNHLSVIDSNMNSCSGMVSTVMTELGSFATISFKDSSGTK
jgi:hypothetical protein